MVGCMAPCTARRGPIQAPLSLPLAQCPLLVRPVPFWHLSPVLCACMSFGCAAPACCGCSAAGPPSWPPTPVLGCFGYVAVFPLPLSPFSHPTSCPTTLTTPHPHQPSHMALYHTPAAIRTLLCVTHWPAATCFAYAAALLTQARKVCRKLPQRGRILVQCCGSSHNTSCSVCPLSAATCRSVRNAPCAWRHLQPPLRILLQHCHLCRP